MKLNRKDFFKGAALGIISLPFAIRGCTNENMAQSNSSPTISGKKYKWKMVTTWPPKFPVLGEGCELFAKWVNEMSGGRMEIKVYGGGELVPALEIFNAVSSGAAEIGHGSAYYWAGIAASSQFFASVPFGMNAQQMNAWLIELYDKFNLLPMPAGNSGVQMGGWFNKEINSVADLQGLKMRMPGLGGKVLAKAGGNPILIAGGELYTSLERGVIDATEWIGPYHDYIMGFHQIAKYYYSPGWHEAGTVLEMFFNKEKFNELPSDLQAILRTAAMRLNMWMLSELEAKNTFYLKKILDESDAELREYPQEVLDELKNYTDEVLVEVTAADCKFL